MQIRCSTCTKTIAIAPTGALPPACPHCANRAVPERLGAYVLDRLVATGGMGEVYLAHHDDLGTDVAIKLLPAMPLDVVDAVRKRFAREARLTAKVDHPGVVKVLHSDVDGDRPYLVLEFVTGRTVRARLSAGELPIAEAARIAAATADVLAAAHRHGVLHRDVKPDNVMLDDRGNVRVLDFGIARALGDDTQLTRTGEIVGTPEYMAPEQLLDGPEATDERTDVHALGVLLHELLTGVSPYRGANLFQSLKLVESLVAKPIGELRGDVPAALQAIVERALQKQACDRFASAAAFRDAVLAAVPMPPLVAGAPLTTAQPPSSRRLRTLMAAVALVAATWFGTLWFRDPPREPDVDVRPVQARREAAVPDLDGLLRDGQWCRVLDDWRLSADANALGIARAAFELHRSCWLSAAGLPEWLGDFDRARQTLLIGSEYEPHGKLPDAVLPRAHDAATRLRQAAAQPTEQRADAFAAFARTLPIEQPEHWLARTIERHLRGDHVEAERAAEMAWLHGAGELAVLLDAALWLPHADADQRAKLWRRVAAGDRDDTPAATPLLLQIEALGVRDVRFDPATARSWSSSQRSSAGSWFVAQAEAAAEPLAFRMLRVATALGQEPDFEVPPWRRLDSDQRRTIEDEANRGR